MQIIPLNASPTKWSNTFKQFAGKLPTNCLSVSDHFVGLALKGIYWIKLQYQVKQVFLMKVFEIFFFCAQLSKCTFCLARKAFTFDFNYFRDFLEISVFPKVLSSSETCEGTRKLFSFWG